MRAEKNNTIRMAGAIWGIGGVIAVLLYAIIRVYPHALEAVQSDLSWRQWVVLLVWCGFMLKSEGIDGFQKRFSPRVVERALHIKQKGNLIQILLAPLYSIGYFGSSRKRMLVSYGATIGIIIMILLVHTLEQPWRGILDSGVVVGLGYGVGSTILIAWRRLTILFK